MSHMKKSTTPLVSIVVPTRNSARTLNRCLESIHNQTLSCEVIVVDNGSTDDTIQIAAQFGFRVLRGGPERSAQRNIGLAACESDIVGFVDSDMILEPQVAAQAYDLITNDYVAAVVPEYTSGTGYWTAVRAYERSMYLENPNVEAARFFQKSLVLQLHGFNEELTGGEDWDLEIRVRQHGRIGRISARIEHDEGKLRYLEACRKKGYYARGYAKFAKEHGIRKLIAISLDRPYIKSPKILLSARGIGLIALKLGELTAILLVVLRQLIIDVLPHHPVGRGYPGGFISFKKNELVFRIKANVCTQNREET